MKIRRVPAYSLAQQNVRQNNGFDKNSSPKLSFKGHQYPSGEYTDEEVAIAKKFINQVGDNWKKLFKKENSKSFFSHYGESHGLNYPLSYVGDILAVLVKEDWGSEITCRKDKAGITRIITDVGSLGIWEIINSPVSATEAGIRKLSERSEVKKKTLRIALLINDMKAEEEAKQIANGQAPLLKAIQEVEKENKMLKMKGEIDTGFSKLITDEALGKKVEIPNVVMIEDQSGSVGKELLNYARQNSDVMYDTVKESTLETMQKDLYETLHNNKERFESTKVRSLVEVENMGKMISKDAPFSMREWMKGVMTACADKYKSTLIFTTKDSSEIISEALEPHRMGLKIINKLKNIR